MPFQQARFGIVTLPALIFAIAGLANCTVQNQESAAPAAGGANGTAGASSGGAAGVEVGTGESGAAGAAGANSAECQKVAGEYQHDAKIGPGCVLLGTTRVRSGTFTIEPGTTLQVERGGSLEVTDSGVLNAVGSVDEPIVFTSDAATPAAGDWGCIAIDADAPGSALDYVHLKYGGADCGARAASLSVASGVDQVTHVDIENGAGHGLVLTDSARGSRQIHDLAFANVEKTSLVVTPESMNALKAPITLDQDDRYIDVDSGALIDVNADVTWHSVGLPYRFDSDVAINSAVTIEPGTILAPTGSIMVATRSGAVLTAIGTAASPITWTSSELKPAAGDWGCIDFTQEKTSRLEYNQFEYGGSCSYGSHEQVLLIEIGASATFKNLSFSNLPDVAIQEAFECPSAGELTTWCAFQYQGVKDSVFCNQSLACK